VAVGQGGQEVAFGVFVPGKQDGIGHEGLQTGQMQPADTI
jgi:hypothetical protein